jgi:hypothetical protein
MSRKYYGDINGTFWFGVQPSDTADRFGVIGEKPTYIEYNFTEDDLKSVEYGLKTIQKGMGNRLEQLQQFYIDHDNKTYNEKDIADYLEVPYEILHIYLKEYADYIIGKKIYSAIKKNKSCSFRAEL